MVETKILNHRGVKTDGRGYAVIPYSVLIIRCKKWYQLEER
ncbi:hypothetical protein [Arsenophonus endosymbiont of Aleurodicus floccissimus]|nr:hypothetical protein [Arsenophonus endosymbiont of Aleurodicus floccissimus]